MTDFNQIRCPKQGCYGWINFIDDFLWLWASGNVWFSNDELRSDIEQIIQKYEYRKNCYSLDNVLTVSNNEPNNYIELVENEWQIIANKP